MIDEATLGCDKEISVRRSLKGEIMKVGDSPFFLFSYVQGFYSKIVQAKMGARPIGRR